MDFLTLAKTRFSTRGFSGRSVEQEKLDRILEAGRVAPTACNNQPQRILVLRSAGSLEKLQKAARVYGAPLVLIVCADHAASWKRSFDGKDFSDIDAAIVATHMVLEATDLGLDSVWIGSFNAAVVRQEFSLPKQVEPIGILGIGYSDSARKSPDRHGMERKPLSATVFHETF